MKLKTNGKQQQIPLPYLDFEEWNIPEDGLTEKVLDMLELLVNDNDIKPSRFIGYPFEPILKLHPLTGVGRFGERVINLLCSYRNYFIEKSSSGNGDYIINNINVEIKTARQQENGCIGMVGIQDTNYDYIILLAIIPTEAFIFTIPKGVMINKVKHHILKWQDQRGYEYTARNLEMLFADFGEYIGLDKFYETFKYTPK